ncbi:MAG: right-handed parallel beta-helix repeat-containing protein [Planctomycetia bacterium]|jgi:hypothetical protein|nr:right-handed parallel beta-helix repeat-containing protein [Planctomycetia bacterium]MCC7314579.1 right-handed parallel beta-helix repeat-containing protein [Planctomycetota bacterium]
MSNRINGYLPVVCILFLIVGQIAEATVRRVKTDATGTPHDGSSWDQAYTDLQTAIDDSTDDDEVWVASMSGTPYKPGMARTSTFTLNSNVAIYGGFVGNESTRDARDFVNNETILSGDIGTPSLATDNCYHVVTASGVGDRTRLDGFTIRDGFSAGFGGGTAGVDRSGAGIYISGANSSPRIFNCIIRDNECTAGNGRGAGLWAPLSSSAQGTLVLNNCQFINNKAGTPGGGAFISNMAETTVTGCRFEDNQSTLETGGDNHGGGMYISGSVTMLVPTPAVTLIDCVFEGNKTARGSGGRL